MGATASAINTEDLADEHILDLVNTFQDACLKAALSEVPDCSENACSPISTLTPEEKMSRLFELADSNHDGKLDEGEITTEDKHRHPGRFAVPSHQIVQS